MDDNNDKLQNIVKFILISLKFPKIYDAKRL